MNNIVWKGVSSTTMDGLLICELPSISKPAMRTKQTVIDGRDGSTIEELGYSSYNKSIVVGLHGNYDINKIIKYFTGEGDLVFSNEPDKVYKGKIVASIDFDRLVRYRKAKVTFLVQPYKYKKDEAMKETEVVTTSGTTIAVNPKADEKLASFRIYGKSTQNGTPTPDAPIDIVSIGDDGTISVTVNDKIANLPIVNALRGIPVTEKSLATYIDASGQKWCADEIDIARGVMIKRVEKAVFDGTEKWIVYDSSYPHLFYADVDKGTTDGILNRCLCSHFPYDKGSLLRGANECRFAAGTNVKRFYISTSKHTDLTAFKNWVAEQYANGNPVTVLYELATPIETPLTEEQIAMFKSLDLSKSATITNDENAYMSVGYFKPYEVFNEGLESSKPLMVLKGSGTVEISVNGNGIFSYTFPEGENEVYIDSEKEDAYLGSVLKNRNMNGEFPILLPKTNRIEWSGDVESIEILPRSRWL